MKDWCFGGCIVFFPVSCPANAQSAEPLPSVLRGGKQSQPSLCHVTHSGWRDAWNIVRSVRSLLLSQALKLRSLHDGLAVFPQAPAHETWRNKPGNMPKRVHAAWYQLEPRMYGVTSCPAFPASQQHWHVLTALLLSPVLQWTLPAQKTSSWTARKTRSNCHCYSISWLETWRCMKISQGHVIRDMI